MKIFLLPYISAIRPNGRIKAALAKINEVGIQLNTITFIINSLLN